MAIKILTDSACDLLLSEAEEWGIRVIPLTLRWDDQEYRDAYDLSPSEFFTKLVNSETIPTTSQVTPAAFEEAMREMTADGDTVIVITLSSVLSGTYQSACIAAEEFGGKVLVVDSLSATVGQRLLIQMALRYIEEGLAADEIVKRLNEDREKVCILARIDTLEYLKKGGRISAAVAFAGNVLSIKPVITVKDGAVELIGKARGAKNANNLLRKFVDEAGGVNYSRPVSLVYSGLSTEALDEYVENNMDLWEGQVSELPKNSIGSVIGTHVGPGALGLAFFRK